MRLALGLVVVAGCARCGSGEAPGREVAERCDPAEPRLCIGNDVVACEPDGVLGRRLQACHDGCAAGRCLTSCAEDGARLIYVVDRANQLLSFDPRELPHDPFRRIGRLACQPRDGGPYSMAIDRQGVAWIMYDDGELFHVSILDASCRRVAYDAGATGFVRFGMGFVATAPGASTEQLYLSVDDASRAFGRIDVARRLTPQRIGRLPTDGDHGPELTGTGEGRLFGFFPARGGPSFVQEIDRATGAAIGRRWPLGDASLGAVTAWAFAQWGGVFYVFVAVTGADGAVTSAVHAVDRATGAHRVVLDHLPVQITGAGVSTCAPDHAR